MKKLIVLAVATTAGLALPAFAQNTTTAPVTGDVKAVHEEIKADKQAVMDAHKTVKADKEALREDIKARHEAVKAGDKEGAKAAAEEVKASKETLKTDIKARHEAHQELRSDRKELREERHERREERREHRAGDAK